MTVQEYTPQDNGRTADGGAAASGPPVTALTLSNGLRVVVLPDDRTTAVTHMIWYNNGAVDDPLGKSGLAHFLEHMMFKGTRRFNADEFQKRISGTGGMMNAFTSWSFTSYFEQVTSEHLEECMAFEADRMQCMEFQPHTVDAERSVILAERGMVVENNPFARLDEALIAASFVSTPQGRPVIGWSHEISAIQRDDIAAYYDRFYRPENAVLVVAGGVQPDEVVAMARRTYGEVPAKGARSPRIRASLPKPVAAQYITLASQAAPQPMVKKAFIVPAHGSGSAVLEAALELLAMHLGGTKTCLLRRRLVIEQKLAIDIGAHYWGDAFPGETVLIAAAVPAQGVAIETLERALDEVLTQVSREGISETELVRAKTQMLAGITFSQDEPTALAHWYGRSLCLGRSMQDIAEWPLRIRALTRDDIRQAAQLIIPKTAVVGYLLPETKPSESDSASHGVHQSGARQ